MAGFYCRNFIWTGTGSESNANADAICKGCTKALIRCGWSLDLSVHTGIDDIKKKGSGNTYCCWYVLNGRTENGAKLLVFYNYYNMQAIKNQCWGRNGSYPSNFSVVDMCLAMIPAGSPNTFGTDPSAESPKFIPNDATYLCGTTQDYNYGYSIARHNTVGRIYEWCFLSNGIDTVSMFVRSDNSTLISFGVGKFIETLAYPDSDSYLSSKYTGLQFSDKSDADFYYQDSAFNFMSYTAPVDSQADMTGGSNSTFVFNAENSRVLPVGTGTTVCRLLADTSLSNRYVCSSYNNGQRRWVQFGIAICNSDPTTGQVIHGADGFKGYLDTNKIRFVGTFNIQREQLLDDGNFLHVANGLCLAWDTSNTIKLTYINSAIDTRNWNGGADPFA